MTGTPLLTVTLPLCRNAALQEHHGVAQVETVTGPRPLLPQLPQAAGQLPLLASRVCRVGELRLYEDLLDCEGGDQGEGEGEETVLVSQGQHLAKPRGHREVRDAATQSRHCAAVLDLLQLPQRNVLRRRLQGSQLLQSQLCQDLSVNK